MADKFDEVKKLMSQIRQKIEAGKKENLEKMIQDAVQKSWSTRPTRKGEFDLSDARNFFKGRDLTLEKALMIDSDEPEIREFQESSDDLYLLSVLLKKPANELNYYETFIQKAGIFRKALDTQEAGGGAEWVPTQMSRQLIERVELERKVASLHGRIPMPTSPYEPPVVTTKPTAYLLGESTGDSPTKIKATQGGTGKFTLRAVKLGARVLFSEELSEDSIIPVLDWVKSDIAAALAEAEENATINGDDSDTHQDSDVTDTNDARKAWKGYRKLALANDETKVDLATFNLTGLRSLRKAMKKYGIRVNNLAYVVGVSAFHQMVDWTEVRTVDKYGPKATVLTGELGKVDGIPIIVSDLIREDLDANGVYSGPGNSKTVVFCVYTPGLKYGDRRKVTIKTKEDIEVDQQILVATQRLDFKPVRTVSGTDPAVVIGYNIST